MADTAALDMARYINLADSSERTADQQLHQPASWPTSTRTTRRQRDVRVTLGSVLEQLSVPSYGCADWVLRQSPPLALPCTAVLVTARQTVPRIFFGGFGVLIGHGSGSERVERRRRSLLRTASPSAPIWPAFNSQQSGVLNAILGTLGRKRQPLGSRATQGLANSYVTVNN